MAKSITEEREGKLLHRLKDVAQGGRTGAFGFMTGAGEAARKRSLVVVARIPNGASAVEQVGAAAAAGVDGVEIAVRDGDDVATLARKVATLPVPCGVYIGDGFANTPEVESLNRFDWIHVAAGAPARLLGGEGPTRLASIAPDLPPGRLSGLSGLHVDAVVVANPAIGGPLTVDSLMALRAIQNATKCPVLVASDLGLAPDDAPVIRDHGIEGVLVRAEQARAFIQAIEAL